MSEHAQDDVSVIQRIAARGDGITSDGRHVSLSAPGDRLAADGGLIFGPHHAEPACRHFPDCGGCQLQQLDEAAYSQFVIDRIVNALDSQDLKAEMLHPAHISPATGRRRVSLRAARHGKHVQLGFSGAGSHRIIDMLECHVMAPDLFALITPLRRFADKWLDRRSQWQIKLAQTIEGVDCLIENFMPDSLEAIEATTEFASVCGLARLSLDNGYGPESHYEPQPVTVTLGSVPVTYPPYGFMQATRDGEAALVAAVATILQDAKLVADLFSGLGTFALNIAQGRKIYAAEADLKAVSALKSAVAVSGLTLATEHRDLFRRPLTEAELNRFDAVILDPPRAGAKDQVKQLATSMVASIAYVSCNPTTFARDAKLLIASGYRLKQVWPVGQFNWSTHVELVGHFSRS